MKRQPTKSLLKSFSKKLRQLREERGFSQSELARRSGIQRTNIVRYENQLNLPDLVTTVRLAAALDVSIEALAPLRPKGPTLSWTVHRHLARLLTRWADYFHSLGSEAFACLVVLEALSIKTKQPRVHFTKLAEKMGVAPNTLRRWLRVLKRAGLVATSFVPGSHNAEAFFSIVLDGRKKRSTDKQLGLAD